MKYVHDLLGEHRCLYEEGCQPEERDAEREPREAEQARIESGQQEPLTEGPIGVAGFLGGRYA